MEESAEACLALVFLYTGKHMHTFLNSILAFLLALKQCHKFVLNVQTI